MGTKTESELKVIRADKREAYEAPVIEDLGQIHEVTQNHKKLPNGSDSPQGRLHASDHQDSGVVGA